MPRTRIWIPCALTFAGAGCGVASLISLIEARYFVGMLWMFLAVLFDGVDGKVASLLDCKSELGETLDSLSDVVAFAVLPGIALYLFFSRSPYDGPLAEIAAWTGGIGYTCAGLFREIRFMTSQLGRSRGQGFVGLPIAPPAGLNVAALVLASLFPETLYRPAGLIVVFVVAASNALLMTVSTFNYLRWGGGAIALQTSVALTAAIATRVVSGSYEAAVAIFCAAFCAIYIYLHPLVVRLARPRRPAAGL